MWIAPSSQSRGAAPRAPQPLYTPDPAGLWADIPGFTAFAQEVAEALNGRDLHYSQRLKLLQRATHFGIRRFDANLIIAMVQNRMEDAQPQEAGPDRTMLVAGLAAVVVVQTLIIAAGWWLLF